MSPPRVAPSPQEKESFKAWLSASASTVSRDDLESRGTLSRADTDASGAWGDLRPSEDSPLQHSLDIMRVRPSADSILRIATHRTSDATTAPRSSAAGRSSVASSAANPSAAAAASARSSFALERASLEANRASLEAFSAALASTLQDPGQQGSIQPPSTAGLTVDLLVQNLGLPLELTDRWVVWEGRGGEGRAGGWSASGGVGDAGGGGCGGGRAGVTGRWQAQ